MAQRPPTTKFHLRRSAAHPGHERRSGACSGGARVLEVEVTVPDRGALDEHETETADITATKAKNCNVIWFTQKRMLAARLPA
jgi:hypothetical protein